MYRRTTRSALLLHAVYGRLEYIDYLFDIRVSHSPCFLSYLFLRPRDVDLLILPSYRLSLT